MAGRFRKSLTMMTLALLVAATAVAATVPTIDIDAGRQIEELGVPSAPAPLRHDWVELLRDRRLDVNDTSVRYPRFIDFCLRVYRWAENTFNSYDPRYVAGTGKHGKVRLVMDNWRDTYYFRVPGDAPLMMAGTPYSNIGVAANYSVLSASYSVDVNSIFTDAKSKYRKMQFAFTCARLYGEFFYWKNSGPTRIRLVGKDLMVSASARDFDGVEFKTLGIWGLYIFNAKKFSLAAAYNLSNYQLRSEGSVMMGISVTHNDVYFDFQRLPQEILDKTHNTFKNYRLEYNSYNFVAGYSYNWVLHRHWLFNVTALPGVGLSFTYSKSDMGGRTLLSLIGRGQLALNYTHRQFFVAATANYHANLILTSDVRTINGVGNLQVSTGVRF